MRTLILLSLCLSAVAAAQPADAVAQSAAPLTYEQLVESAHQAANQSRFTDAVSDLEAAYKMRQEPKLLIELARGHRHLGHVKETADYYQRYRLASGDMSPEIVTEIDSATRANAPAFNYGYAPPAAPAMKSITRPNQAMLISGATLFSVAYTAAAVTGGVFSAYGGDVSTDSYANGHSLSTSNGNSAVAGGILFIPFFGPFLSAIADRDPTWVGPWIGIDGGMQLLGLGLMIASRFHPQTARVLAKLPSISPYAGPNGAGANVAFRF